MLRQWKFAHIVLNVLHFKRDIDSYKEIHSHHGILSTGRSCKDRLCYNVLAQHVQVQSFVFKRLSGREYLRRHYTQNLIYSSAHAHYHIYLDIFVEQLWMVTVNKNCKHNWNLCMTDGLFVNISKILLLWNVEWSILMNADFSWWPHNFAYVLISFNMYSHLEDLPDIRRISLLTFKNPASYI